MIDITKDCFAILVKDVDENFYNATSSLYDEFVVLGTDVDDLKVLDKDGKEINVESKDVILMSNHDSNYNILTTKQLSILNQMRTKYEAELHYGCVVSFWT